MIRATILLIVLALFVGCKTQTREDSVYNKKYVIGPIPCLASFEACNEYDKKLDSIYKPSQDTYSILGEGGYLKNRSRIIINSFTNDKQAQQDSALYMGMPTPCYNHLDKDTLYIKVGIGFFGGMGFDIKIFKDEFQSNYFMYIDDVKPYKYKLSDSGFTDNLYLRNKYQSLILNVQPTFKPGQQITGYLTFTTPMWYENNFGDSIESDYIKGSLYFTCVTKI